MPASIATFIFCSLLRCPHVCTLSSHNIATFSVYFDAGDGNSAVAVAAMRLLLAAGAVPDTWAPNGSSALMLAAAANGVAALQECVRVHASSFMYVMDSVGCLVQCNFFGLGVCPMTLSLAQTGDVYVTSKN